MSYTPQSCRPLPKGELSLRYKGKEIPMGKGAEDPIARYVQEIEVEIVLSAVGVSEREKGWRERWLGSTGGGEVVIGRVKAQVLLMGYMNQDGLNAWDLSEICSNYSSDLRDLYEELFRKQLEAGKKLDYLGGFLDGLARDGTKGAHSDFWLVSLGDILYVEDVFVEHPYRGHGIGLLATSTLISSLPSFFPSVNSAKNASASHSSSSSGSSSSSRQSPPLTARPTLPRNLSSISKLPLYTPSSINTASPPNKQEHNNNLIPSIFIRPTKFLLLSPSSVRHPHVYSRPDWIDQKAFCSPSDKEKREAERGLETYWGLLGFRKWEEGGRSQNGCPVESDGSLHRECGEDQGGSREGKLSESDGLGGLKNTLIDQYEKGNCDHGVQIDHELRAELWGMRANERKGDIERLVPGLFV